MARSAAALFLSTCLAAITIGCGTAAGTNSQAATEEGLAEAAEGFFVAMADGDASKLYDAVPNRCREETTVADMGAIATGAAMMLEGFMGVDMADLEVVEVRTRDVTNTSGDALVILEVDGEPFTSEDDEFQPWIYEDDRWRSDEPCSEFNPDQTFDFDSDDAATGSDSDGATALDTIPLDTIPPVTEAEPVDAALGEAIVFEEWTTYVDSVQPDPPQEYESTPEPGQRYVAVRGRIEYTGSELTASPFLSPTLVGGAVYETYDNPCLITDDPTPYEWTSGQTAEVVWCYEVPSDETAWKLQVEDGMSFDSAPAVVDVEI